VNNITKNLLLGLTLICIIALVVFCIQLIVLNRGVAPVEPGATVSGGSQQSGSDSSVSGEDGDSSHSGANGENGSDSAPPLVVRPPPQGTRRVLPITQGSRLVTFSDDDLFYFSEGDMGWLYEYSGQGEATLEIAFTLIVAQGGVSEHAVSYLNTYAGIGNAIYTGEESLHGSPLRGYHASSAIGAGTYEIWIHILPDSDLALGFIIYHETEHQRESLYNMLSWLEME